MIFGECCDCECHEEGRNIKHIMVCCQTCPHCHKRIDFAMYEKHKTKCEDAHNPVVNNEVRLNEIIEAIMLLQKAGLNTASTTMHLTEMLDSLKKN